MTVEFTDANFEELALKTEKPVLVDFLAEWCAPWRTVGPFVAVLPVEYGARAVKGKGDVDSNPEIASKSGMRSITTYSFFKNDAGVEQHVSAVA